MFSPEQIEPLIEAAARLSLPHDREQVQKSGSIRGELDGVQIALGFHYKGSVPEGFALIARGSRPFAGRVVIRPRGGAQPSLQIGDRWIDESLRAQGPRLLVHALFTDGVRRELKKIYDTCVADELVFRADTATLRGSFNLRAEALAAMQRTLVVIVREHWFERREVMTRLLHVLHGDPDIAVRCATAAALGKVGPPSAIAELERSVKGFFVDRALKRAVERAIAQLRARHGGAAEGALSLAGEDQRGALSVPDAGEGALSLDDEAPS